MGRVLCVSYTSNLSAILFPSPPFEVTMAKEEHKNTVEIKPGFDGRLEYFKAMSMYMQTFAVYKISEPPNIQGMFNALEGMFILAAPYIKKSYREEIDEELESIRTHLNIDNIYAKDIASRKLKRTAMKLYDYGKHILLPQSMDESIEVDWESVI